MPVPGASSANPDLLIARGRWAELDAAVLGAPLCLLPWEAPHWDGELDVPEYHRAGRVGTTGWAFPRFLPDPVPMPPPDVAPARLDVVPELAALSPAVGVSAFRGTAWQAAAVTASERSGRSGAEFALADAYPSLIHLVTGETAYGRFDGDGFRENRWAGQAVGRRSLSVRRSGDAASSPPRTHA